MPTLIGEIGIAMDLNGGTAFLAPEDPTAPLAPGEKRGWRQGMKLLSSALYIGLVSLCVALKHVCT